MKKIIVCLLLVAVLMGSGFNGSADYAAARKVNEYEGQH